MKYVYKNTNTVVESERPLDSALFTPYSEKPEKPQKAPAKRGKPAARSKKQVRD